MTDGAVNTLIIAVVLCICMIDSLMPARRAGVLDWYLVRNRQLMKARNVVKAKKK